jgi:hypothetical protein
MHPPLLVAFATLVGAALAGIVVAAFAAPGGIRHPSRRDAGPSLGVANATSEGECIHHDAVALRRNASGECHHGFASTGG